MNPDKYNGRYNDFFKIIHIISLLLVLISFFIVIWYQFRHKKEEMQSRFFLRSENLKRAIILLLIAFILQLFLNLPEIEISEIYRFVGDIITILLIILGAYYFRFKVISADYRLKS